MNIFKKFNIKNKQIFINSDDYIISYSKAFKTILLIREVILDLNIQEGTIVGVCITEKYLQILTIISCWSLNLNVISISSLQPCKEVNDLKKKIGFDFIISDSIISNILSTKNNMIKNNTFIDSNPSSQSELLTIITSGSTGDQKGVVLSLENLFYSALGSIDFYNINEEDKYLLSLPLNHIGGIMIFVRSMIAGCQVVISNSKIENTINKFIPTLISLVPLQLHRFLTSKNTAVIKNLADHSKAVLIGGAPCPPSITSRALDKLIPISLTYGQSETCAQVSATHPGKINDINYPDGEVLKYRSVFTDKSGKIMVGGKVIFKHYIIAGKKTFPETVKKLNCNDIYFITKDLGHYNCKHKTLSITGRSDDILIYKGQNIAPREIENIVIKHQNVISSKLISFKEDNIETSLYLLILCNKHLVKIDDLFIMLNRKLPKYKIPKEIVLLDEKTFKGIKLTKKNLEEYIKSNK